MKVRLTMQMSGSRDGQDWPAAGTVVDLPDAEARGLIAGGSAVAEGDEGKGGKVLVPPAGVHTPGTTAMGGGQPLVEAPADAVSDPEGVEKAIKDVREGNFVEVDGGVGVQNPSGLAMSPDEVKKSTEAEERTQESLRVAAPKVGERTPKKP